MCELFGPGHGSIGCSERSVEKFGAECFATELLGKPLKPGVGTFVCWSFNIFGFQTRLQRSGTSQLATFFFVVGFLPQRRSSPCCETAFRLVLLSSLFHLHSPFCACAVCSLGLSLFRRPVTGCCGPLGGLRSRTTISSCGQSI